MSVDMLENIRAKIENGEIELAFDELKELTNDSPSKIKREIVTHRANYHRYDREHRQDIITYDQYSAKMAKLNHSILQFVDDLEKKFNEQLPINLTKNISIELPKDTALEKIIGVNNLKEISWLRQGLEFSSSVCRILTPIGLGTGFMIGPNLLMTNNHVIPTVEVACQSVAEFNYELDPLGHEWPSSRYQINADLFHTSDKNHLDYTIVSVSPNPELPPLKQWGELKFNTAALPCPNEHVTIIQHPGGRFKQIALTANQIVNREEQYLYYTTDTMEGSSGSPVFNDAWEVIAIHRAYGDRKKDPKGNQRYVNEGVLMEAILADILERDPKLYLTLTSKVEDGDLPPIPVDFEWMRIPGGKFFKGKEERSVYVPEYFMAKVPVTNAQYKQFIDATDYETPMHWEKKGLFRTSTHIPENKADHPVVNVTWDDAQEFCKWAGVLLPTEEQWEKAARGIDRRRYPWGNQPPNMLICNFRNVEDDTTAVDKYLEGKSAYGCLDMSGNVWEWIANTDGSEACLMCGGAFNSNEDNLFCISRNQDTSNKAFPNVGFRVSMPIFVS